MQYDVKFFTYSNDQNNQMDEKRFHGAHLEFSGAIWPDIYMTL